MGSSALATQSASLPEAVSKRNLNEAQWRTLCNNLFPGAHVSSVLMVVDYCHARKLDPLKKPCHIVPMEVKDAKTNKYEWRDVVMPGIYEYRTTAQRTGQYLGHAKAIYGPPEEFAGVTAPEWCEITAYRWNSEANMRAEFPVTVFFREVVATKRDGQANARWSKAPIQMLTKCTEAAALREAFPDELGGEQTAEEMDGQRAPDVVIEKVERPKPDEYDAWVVTLKPEADRGEAALLDAFTKGTGACRDYLTAVDNELWESLKDRALDADVAKQ